MIPVVIKKSNTVTAPLFNLHIMIEVMHVKILGKKNTFHWYIYQFSHCLFSLWANEAISLNLLALSGPVWSTNWLKWDDSWHNNTWGTPYSTSSPLSITCTMHQHYIIMPQLYTMILSQSITVLRRCAIVSTVHVEKWLRITFWMIASVLLVVTLLLLL